jgi:hypothetical protein
MSLLRTHLPSAWGHYAPTIWDWTIFAGTVGLFATMLLLTLRVVPMVSMYEMRELLTEKQQT